MQNDSVTIEWAPFRARPGVTDDEVRAAAAAIQGEDAASAEAAMTKVGDSAACARYFALMAGDPSDPSAVQHLTRVASY
jgi:hypothetical protein